MACIKSVFNKLELELELGRDTKRLLVDVPAILSFFFSHTIHAAQNLIGRLCHRQPNNDEFVSSL